MQNQSTAEARLRTLLEEGDDEGDDENGSHPEPATDQTTAAGYMVDLIFPAEDRPNG